MRFEKSKRIFKKERNTNRTYISALVVNKILYHLDKTYYVGRNFVSYTCHPVCSYSMEETLLEKLGVAHTVKKFDAFYGIENFITTLIRSRLILSRAIYYSEYTHITQWMEKEMSVEF
jgi:hypothetical protein